MYKLHYRIVVRYNAGIFFIVNMGERTEPFTYISAACNGAPEHLGDRVPLDAEVHITVKLDQHGEPIQPYGCGYYAGGDCLAVPEIDRTRAPKCLYSHKRRQEEIDASTQEEHPYAVMVSPGSNEKAVIIPGSRVPVIKRADAGGFLVLGSQAHILNLDFATFKTETERRLALEQGIADLTREYLETLLGAGRQPKKTGMIFRELDINPYIFTRNKRLANGREDEVFKFLYHYDEDTKKLKKIVVEFPESSFQFEVMDNEITSITLALGKESVRFRGEEEPHITALSVLKRYFTDESKLANFVAEARREGIKDQTKEGDKLNGSVTLTIPLKSPGFIIKNKYWLKGKQYQKEHDFSYSPQEGVNQFITKDSVYALSVDDYLTILQDIFEILPFARIAID